MQRPLPSSSSSSPPSSCCCSCCCCESLSRNQPSNKHAKTKFTRPTARGNSGCRGSPAWCGRTTAHRSGPATRACDTCLRISGFRQQCQRTTGRESETVSIDKKKFKIVPPDRGGTERGQQAQRRFPSLYCSPRRPRPFVKAYGERQDVP